MLVSQGRKIPACHLTLGTKRPRMEVWLGMTPLEDRTMNRSERKALDRWLTRESPDFDLDDVIGLTADAEYAEAMAREAAEEAAREREAQEQAEALPPVDDSEIPF